jgi:hypothetical protein
MNAVMLVFCLAVAIPAVFKVVLPALLAAAPYLGAGLF